MFTVGMAKGGEKLADAAATGASFAMSGIEWGLRKLGKNETADKLSSTNAKVCNFIKTDWSGKYKEVAVTNNSAVNGFHSEFLNKNVKYVDSTFEVIGEATFDYMVQGGGSSYVYKFAKKVGEKSQKYLSSDKIDINNSKDRAKATAGAIASGLVYAGSLKMDSKISYTPPENMRNIDKYTSNMYVKGKKYIAKTGHIMLGDAAIDSFVTGNYNPDLKAKAVDLIDIVRTEGIKYVADKAGFGNVDIVNKAFDYMVKGGKNAK